MAHITIYLDETGDAADPDQTVAGMGGLLGMEEDWIAFERKWKKSLSDFKVPYFHMREFVKSKKAFEGWDGKRLKRGKLIDRLITIIETANVVPFGSIMPLQAWRGLTERQRKYFVDPYYFSAQDCVWNIMSIMIDRPPQERATIIFSDKKRVKNKIRLLFDALREDGEIRERICDPTFHEMRTSTPLQGADMVAHIMSSELRRQLQNEDRKPNDAYLRLEKVQRRNVGDTRDLFHFRGEAGIKRLAQRIEKNDALRRGAAG